MSSNFHAEQTQPTGCFEGDHIYSVQPQAERLTRAEASRQFGDGGLVMRRSLGIAVAFVVAFFWFQGAHAGNNFGGTAYLSWDVAGQVPVLSQPVAQPFPLYLHLVGASDVHSLSVNIRWAPYDSTGACYSMITAGPEATCGAANDTVTGDTFAGDSSFTWSIRFAAEDAAKDCVMFWFSMASCDTAPPAKFIIGSIAALDANGLVDTLANIGDAKLTGVAGADTSWWLVRRTTDPPPPPTTVTFTLFPHPNPTTSDLQLDLWLPTREIIDLGIYDLAGRTVRKLAQGGALGTGLHRYRWDLRDEDGRRVPNGVYFARAAATHGSRLVRIVVVK